jgi:xylan 1,4-beta-xylosidase
MAKATRSPKGPPEFRGNISFNAQHSPLGAFFSFTCGQFGSRSGLGLQIGKPADQDLFIGVKEGDRFAESPLKCLPFFQGANADEAARYDVEGQSAGAVKQPGLVAYAREEIKRFFGYATDRWTTRELEFSIYTQPLESVEQSTAPVPVVYAELKIDNRKAKKVRTGVFAIRTNAPGTRLLRTPRFDLPGFAVGRSIGAAAWVQGEGPDEEPGVIFRWDADVALRDVNPTHLLGSTPGFYFEVQPGEVKTLRIVLGCHVAGSATTGIEAGYRYARQLGSLEDVLDAGRQFDDDNAKARLADDELSTSGLNADQQFLVAHATRSYLGSTQLLDVGGDPYWIVNEGEYCMINTLDLSVDHVFWELKQNPWVVKNLLDNFVRHYSYVDQVKVPKKKRGEAKAKFAASDDSMNAPRVLGETRPMSEFELRPGGISFCHDQGVNNQFSPRGDSSYELPNLVGCFSYMTAEQLCNWSLMAACYVARTDDTIWLMQNLPTIDACLRSMINRGGDAGFCQYDSSRCQTGSEITTYDSLDHSLAQTRNNVYMATKSWATYLGLKLMLEKAGRADRAKVAGDMAMTVEATVLKHVQPDGTLPAVFEKDNPGYHSKILPACEGLIYPWFWKDPILKRSRLVKVLRKHTQVLLESGTNVFEDGGIKLSSTSNNSWMSKIAIFMHVCRRVLDLGNSGKVRELFKRADAAHVRWQTEGESAYWACSDQMVSGVAKGSKYYPRIITSALWLD